MAQDGKSRCRQASHGRPAGWVLWLLACTLLMAMSPSHASKLTERAKQKQLAESERAGLQQKLNALKRDIQKTEGAKDHAADELAHSGQAISKANRALHELAIEQRQARQKLAELSQEHTRLTRSVENQQDQLAKLIRQQHMAGSEDRVKLLLSGDNPNRINRELRYLGYVSQAQATLLASLRANLAQIEVNQEAAQNAQEELDEIAQEAQVQKQLLEQEKAKHATLLAQLSSKLAAQRKEANHIERDEQRLGNLVGRLERIIEEQRKAEALAAKRRQAAERQRLAKLEAQRRAQQQKLAKAGAKTPNKVVNPDAIEDDEPPKSYGRNELTPEAPVQNGVVARAFASLRGQLRLPVKGELLAKFGSKREDGPAWKGLFIAAAEGSDIKAVAAGQVIFADWLRGFGNLIIVDHGSQYLTIYGYNQAVLKRAGDAVNMGEIIASAGSSGGHGQSGLYFEMRHQGRAFDPLLWINFR